MRSFILSFCLLFIFTACGDDSSLTPQQEEAYTDTDGRLNRSDVNKFQGRKTLPRKCGDLPF